MLRDVISKECISTYGYEIPRLHETLPFMHIIMEDTPMH